MKSSFLALLCLALVALAAARYGSHEFGYNNYAFPYDTNGSQESREESAELNEVNRRGLSFYTKDVLHGLGPQHSFLTIDFPKPNFPAPYKPDFQQPHFGGAPKQSKEEVLSAYNSDYQPRYESHEQYAKSYARPEAKPQFSVERTRDGKKIMTMTKPGYKMVVEEMEGTGDDHSRMVGRTVKENKSSKVKGDNGETMQQSQSYQYQVVEESSDEYQPQSHGHVERRNDLKGIDFSRFAQPQKSNNFPAQFPGQYGFQQHQQFVKAQQQQNPFGFQVPDAFKDLRIAPGIRQHYGF